MFNYFVDFFRFVIRGIYIWFRGGIRVFRVVFGLRGFFRVLGFFLGGLVWVFCFLVWSVSCCFFLVLDLVEFLGVWVFWL